MLLKRRNLLWHAYDTHVFDVYIIRSFRIYDTQFVGVHMIRSFRVHMIHIYPTILILPIAYHMHTKVNFCV